MIGEVLVELSNRLIDKTFSYIIPLNLINKIKIGMRVKVNFNNTNLEGFVINIKKDDGLMELKEIVDVVDEEAILNEELLELGKYIKEKYFSTLINAYQAMLPKALKASNKTNISKKYVSYFSLNISNQQLNDYKFNKTQKLIIDKIKIENKVKKEDLKLFYSSLKTLLYKNILKEEKVEVYRLKNTNKITEQLVLNSSQKDVVNAVLSSEKDIFLLHGVTGSGKTLVYMNIIEEMLKKGLNSVILVPEISLTPQIVNQFKNRFGDIVAILHSKLSEGEKYDEYRKIVNKKVNIVIGARSAIFAPLKNIGIFIIDEEHSLSYKQETNPKYSAIDIAKKRAKYHHAKILLGSATPTMESYARAKKGVYQLLELKNRANNKPLPDVLIVDLANSMKKNNSFFSTELIEGINDTLKNNEQIMLLQNKRGYASFITCRNCGYVERCPVCDISLTYHKTSNMLRCHYCGYAIKKENKCHNCHEEALENFGVGTEKVMEELEKIFPKAKIIRMDFDTTTTKNAHENIINDFNSHKYDILLGTQMIAKGLDFPLVTLVGVINADISLNIPDFRSSENTFSLLNQVSGRSGRGTLIGRVIIQTFNPNHYAIALTKNHDYISFYNKEMNVRKQLGYPPYFYLVMVKIISKDYSLASKNSIKVYNYLINNLLNCKILGPSTSSIFKFNNSYSFSILIKHKANNNLSEILNKLLDHYKKIKEVKIDIDVDPNRL